MQKQEIVIHPDQRKDLTVGNKTFRSALDFHLTEKDLEIAHLELGETEALKKISLEKLKQKLQGHQDGQFRTDDHYMLRYLRFAKFDVDKAFKLITKLYKLRSDCPDAFSLSSDLENFLKSDLVRFLPYRDEDGCIIAWMKFSNWDASKMNLVNMIRVSSAFIDLLTMNPSFQVHGACSFWDVEGFSMSHFNQLVPKPLFLKQYLQDCITWRVKRIILFNSSKLVQKVYNLAQPIFKKKIMERVKVVGSDLNDLHQCIDRSLLPRMYGGTVDESECIGTAFVMQNLEYLKYERSFTKK